MRFDRQAGVFLHPTSLPAPHGVGDLGAGARAFVDFLADAGQSIWQFCPLGPTSGAHGHSPYQSFSAFAGTHLLVDLRDLLERGYLEEPLDPPETSPHEVRYDRVAAFKRDRLRAAHERFAATASEAERDAFAAFRDREADWLADYALFMALKGVFGGDPWTEWPAPLRRRDPEALDRRRERHAGDVAYHAFVQWTFDRQWRALREYAAERGVTLMGDVPLYVALDSADVWANQAVFDLAEDGSPAAVAGVPPNPGDDGQRWGNPVYDWDRLRERDYGWWLERLERLLDLVDMARIDHFKGFDEFWAIPADSDDPGRGEWRPGPGADFFEAVEDALGDLPFVVEDLGFLDEGVIDLRERFGFPGMRVPHYADWCREGHLYRPATYPENCAGYTSTHDTDTVVGYYGGLDDGQRACLAAALGTDGEEIHWDVIEAVWNADAALAFTTVPDLLGLGSEARFNTPGTLEGNWRWRVTEAGLDPGVADRLGRLTDATLR
ncbi:MAG: 4-alpha-glucanotransferase [Halobacteriales archaeon]